MRLVTPARMPALVAALGLASCAPGGRASVGVFRAGEVVAAIGGAVAIYGAYSYVSRAAANAVGRDTCEGWVSCHPSTLFWSGAVALVGGALAAAVAHGAMETEALDASARATTQDRPTAAIPGDQPSHYFCTESPTGTPGSCTETRDGCERVRAIHIAASHEMTACGEQRRVVCFGYSLPDGGGHVACAPTVPACNAIRSGLEHRGRIATLQECAELP